MCFLCFRMCVLCFRISPHVLLNVFCSWCQGTSRKRSTSIGLPFVLFCLRVVLLVSFCLALCLPWFSSLFLTFSNFLALPLSPCSTILLLSHLFLPLSSLFYLFSLMSLSKLRIYVAGFPYHVYSADQRLRTDAVGAIKCVLLWFCAIVRVCVYHLRRSESEMNNFCMLFKCGLITFYNFKTISVINRSLD